MALVGFAVLTKECCEGEDARILNKLIGNRFHNIFRVRIDVFVVQ